MMALPPFVGIDIAPLGHRRGGRTGSCGYMEYVAQFFLDGIGLTLHSEVGRMDVIYPAVRGHAYLVSRKIMEIPVPFRLQTVESAAKRCIGPFHIVEGGRVCLHVGVAYVLDKKNRSVFAFSELSDGIVGEIFHFLRAAAQSSTYSAIVDEGVMG